MRAEQRFSHRLVLAVQTVIAYIAQAAAYRASHELPGSPPPLPDVDELQELIKLRPTYGPDDEA